MTTWDPESYLKYRDERTQPSHDLVARIELVNPANVVDIGCGPGNSTEVLRQRWPAAHITGLDSSPEMIAKAKATYPQGDWLLADAATWQPSTAYDLVFSNATLQWIPHHEALVGRLFAMVAAGGALAVQIPANYDSPLFSAISRVAKMEPWQEVMAGCDERLIYRDPAFYYNMLAALSPQSLVLWQTIYYHIMPTQQSLIDWYASTGMRPYLERLGTDDEKKTFQAQVLAACRADYPLQSDQKVLFPFRRLFFIAYRG